MNKPEQKTELLNRIEDLWIDAASILTQEERLDAISTLANSSKAPSNRKDQSIKERIQRLMQDAETLSTPVNYESDDDLKDDSNDDTDGDVVDDGDNDESDDVNGGHDNDDDDACRMQVCLLVCLLCLLACLLTSSSHPHPHSPPRASSSLQSGQSARTIRRMKTM